MTGTTLDTGALIALEASSRRMLALVETAVRTGSPLVIPAGVLAQSWRGGARQARIARLLRSSVSEIVVLDRSEALSVGALCARTGTVDVVDEALDSLSSNPRLVAQWVGLISAGLIAISGISTLPGWLHPIAQFPFYWLGLGMRSALRPDAAAAVELSGSWQHLETVGAWAVVGLVLAPVVLDRMARRQSGADVEAAGRKPPKGSAERVRSCTTGSPCCAPSGGSPGASSPRRSGSTTRPSATWSGASTAPACTWRCESRSTSRCRWR